MKIALFNPNVDAGRKIADQLRPRDTAVLFAQTAAELTQILQLFGTSVDLAVIHREGAGGQGQPGVDLISAIKADPNHTDLPIILITEKWLDEQCAEHQKTANGANAYLKSPFPNAKLVETIEAVLGQKLGTASNTESLIEIPTAAGEPSVSSKSVELVAAELIQAEEPKLEFISNSNAVPPPLPEMSETGLPGVLEIEIPNTNATSSEMVEIPIKQDDKEIESELPYLFSGKKSETTIAFTQPLGDAVVPGGAAQAPDLETLKKYLLLREQDVAALSAQLKSAKEHLQTLDENLRQERAVNLDLTHKIGEQERKIGDFEREKQAALEALQTEIDEYKFQMKAKTDKARVLEAKVKEAVEETERLKERVRTDIRKIRVREKELENRLEIMKKDSEALIAARENKIIELKRKLDLLEFNMDLIQDQLSRERELSVQLKARLNKAAQAIKLAGGLLDDEDSEATTNSDTNKDSVAS